MAKASKPKSAKAGDGEGIFDVSKPGKSAPSATSRPIIVTSRPILQDPMFAPDAKPAAAAKPSEKITVQPISIQVRHDDGSDGQPKAEETTVKPLVEPIPEPDTHDKDEVAAPAEEAPEAQKPAATDEASKPKDEAAEAQSEEATQEEPKPAADTSAGSQKEEAVEEPAEQTGEDKAKPALSPEEQEAAAKRAEEEIAAHTAAIQKLAESREYYLPINSLESRKTRRFVLLGAVLILVLGAAWVDVALDAGLVQLSGVKPLTHFFTN